MSILTFIPGPNFSLPEPAAIALVAPTEGIPIWGQLRMPPGIARGVVVDGVMIAWAVAGQPRDGVSAITAETAPAHRGRGYASACVRAVTLACPHPVLYRCDARNLASQKCARKAGFVLVDPH